ncbi:DUF559 domain-containing protein [Candidatus Microgenomates bacterium]|nr:DUF559 domain-containing protein [Candidatus Microgenomates bacterium]
MSDVSLANLVKYCHGYLNLINPARSRINLKTEFLDKDILDPDALLTDAVDEKEERYLLNFSKFYSVGLDDYDELSDEDKERYELEKEIINQVDAIKAKAETDEFTKYIQLNFGFIDLTAKHIFEEVEVVSDENGKKNEEQFQFSAFSIPVKVERSGDKYYLTLLDNRLTPNFSLLGKILEEDKYYQFLEEMNKLEMEGLFSLPVKMQVLDDVYINLVSNLKKTKGVSFRGDPLDLTHLTISLSSKSNYFLTQDLDAIENEIEEDQLLETALSGWLTTEGLDEDANLDSSEGQLLFPFASDKYQRSVLGITKNRVSIVQGPPGTGKSQTIANLLCHFAAQGKSVLFVSQKDQAIRVVKDTLKELGIPGLFGYIPNRYSLLHTKEDETDGAANELSRLKTELNREAKLGTPVFQDIDIVDASLRNFETNLELERKYFKLSESLRDLDKYDLQVSDETAFSKTDFKIYLNDLIKLYEAIKQLEQQLVDVMKVKVSSSLRGMLDGINLERYPIASSKIGEFSGELRRNLRDRGGIKALRKLQNKLAFNKLVKVSDDIPAKAVEIIRKLIDQDFDKDDLESKLNVLKSYFLQYELEAELAKQRKALEALKKSCGLSDESLSTLERLYGEEGGEAIENALEAHKLKVELQAIKDLDINLANSVIHKARVTHQTQVRSVLHNIIRKRATEALSTSAVRSIIERVSRSFAKSKRAYKTFDKLKENPQFFETVQSIFPIWLMSLEDVSRVTPLTLNMFDYVIIDESSQCNLGYALPSMVRANHCIFFGDTLQMRDDTIRFKSNNIIQQLAKKYEIPDYLQIKSANDSVKSVMDIGVLRGYIQKTLRIHYRSPRELIGFSNDWFYKPLNRYLEIANSTFYPYKDTNRALINHVIKSDRDQELSLKTNTDEVKYIVKLIADIRSTPNYNGESIGVLTFFNDQAALLREEIDDETIKVSNIEGIQGDERDIIIYSFVISDLGEKKRYIALTGEGGEINKELNEGRVNVAFSRARKQVHCVTSMPPEQWPEGIWIKRYLEYVDENGKLDRLLTEGVDRSLFDSFFEEDLCTHLGAKLSKDYILQNQVKSCGFKIDFVLTERSTGKKLAIECDGPTHFEDESDEIVVESDWERQSILESAGWKFYRLPYSRWVTAKNKETVVKEILDTFNDPSKINAITYKKFSEVIGLKVEDEIATDEETQHSPKESAFNSVAGLNLDDVSPSETPKVRKAKATKTEDAEFKEIGRVGVEAGQSIAVSTYDGGSKISISEHLSTGGFTGFTKKNVSIDANDRDQLIEAINEAIASAATNVLHWAGQSDSKSVIVSQQYRKIDIRQWIKTPSYSGYTKKGFRIDSEVAEALRDILFQI